MLLIREEQLLAFSREQEERFVRELCQYARNEFPAETSELADGDHDAISRQAISNARGYGIAERADIYRFLNFMLIYGLEFDDDLPWAREILNTAQDRSGTIKMLELYEEAIAFGKEAVSNIHPAGDR